MNYQKQKIGPGYAQTLINENTPEVVRYYIENWKSFEGINTSTTIDNILKYIGSHDQLSNNSLAINIGANTGKWLPQFKDFFPGINILCFEPHPEPYSRLKEYETDSKLNAYQIAISDTNGNATLYSHPDLDDSQVAGLQSGGDKICDVEVKTLDSFIKNKFFTVNNIKVLIIDTEGHEWNVFNGATTCLQSTDYIIHENSDCLSDHRGPDIANPVCSIINLLDGKGFDTYKIGKDRLLKMNGRNNWYEIYENFTFWSDCFSIKKNNSLINKIIDTEGYILI